MFDLIRPHLDRATLIGWRLRPKVMITSAPDVMTIIRLQWRDRQPGPWAVRPGDPEDGAGVDLDDLPKGVKAIMWQPPPDDTIACDRPSSDDVRRLARQLGRSRITRQDHADGTTVWVLDMTRREYDQWMRS